MLQASPRALAAFRLARTTPLDVQRRARAWDAAGASARAARTAFPRPRRERVFCCDPRHARWRHNGACCRCTCERWSARRTRRRLEAGLRRARRPFSSQRVRRGRLLHRARWLRAASTRTTLLGLEARARLCGGGWRAWLRFARRMRWPTWAQLLLLPHGAAWRRTPTCWSCTSSWRVASRAQRWQQRWPAPRAPRAVRRLGPPWAWLLLLLRGARWLLAACSGGTTGPRERVVVALAVMRSLPDPAALYPGCVSVQQGGTRAQQNGANQQAEDPQLYTSISWMFTLQQLHDVGRWPPAERAGRAPPPAALHSHRAGS